MRLLHEGSCKGMHLQGHPCVCALKGVETSYRNLNDLENPSRDMMVILKPTRLRHTLLMFSHSDQERIQGQTALHCN